MPSLETRYTTALATIAAAAAASEVFLLAGLSSAPADGALPFVLWMLFVGLIVVTATIGALVLQGVRDLLEKALAAPAEEQLAIEA